MDKLISRQNEEEAKSISVGDKVQSRLPADRYRRSGEILSILNSGTVLIKWDMIQEPERLGSFIKTVCAYRIFDSGKMRAQALVKL